MLLGRRTASCSQPLFMNTHSDNSSGFTLTSSFSMHLFHIIVYYYKCTWSIWAVDPLLVLGEEGAGQRMRIRYGMRKKD